MSPNASTAASYFADPTSYVRNNPYIKLRSRMIREMLSHVRHGSILDVGAGSGEVTIPMLDTANRLLFVDSSQGMLDLAMTNVPVAHRDRVQAIRASVMDFSSEDRFDAVVCVGVLAHVPRWRDALRRLSSWVTSDGVLAVQLTDQSAMLGALTHRLGRVTSRLLGRATHEHQRMILGDVEHELGAIGFGLVDSRRYCFVPGLRVLPDWMSVATIRLASQGLFASRHGGEVIAIFQRKGAGD